MMSRMNRFLVLLVLVALLLNGCQPVMQQTTGATQEAASLAQPSGLRPDAPAYAVHGPYAVGVRYFTIESEQQSDRTLKLTVWYPALNPAGAEAAITYVMALEPGETAPWQVNGHALMEADADVSGGPYPLVVYSHAHTGFSAGLAYFVEHLASHGFVVMAVDHQDNPLTTFGQKAWQTEYQRPEENRRVIAYAETLTAAGGALAGLIDTERIGVAGFSLGGGDAFAAGGARLNLDNFRALCESGSQAIETYLLRPDCVNVLKHEKELATLAGLDAVPEGLWPDWGDPRVDAVVAMGPTVEKFGTAGLQSIKVPTLLMIGSADPIVVRSTHNIVPIKLSRQSKRLRLCSKTAAI